MKASSGRNGNGGRTPSPLNRHSLKALAWRRRRSLATWEPLGCQRCTAYVDGTTCRYFTAPEHCGAFRTWQRGAKEHVPVCLEERNALLKLSASLTLCGVDDPLATVLAGNLIRAAREKDSRLSSETAKHLTSLQVESIRARTRATAQTDSGYISDKLRGAIASIRDAGRIAAPDSNGDAPEEETRLDSHVESSAAHEAESGRHEDAGDLLD
jgi:hypothetical protein